VPIKVPLLNQNDPANGTLGSVACGPTSLAMIASYYGIDISTAQVIQDTNVNSSGTNLSTLANVAKQIGLTDTTSNSGIISGLYDAFTGGSAAYSGVSQAVSNGNPVIVNVDESPYSNGHAMVVTGISGDDVYVNNPWTGQSQVYGKTQFMAMWGSEGYGYIVPKP
jgi:ABC-type bacteriocin/lantibiotic exporter with double-glycine peptidase domain